MWSVRFYGKDLLISGAGDGQIKVTQYIVTLCTPAYFRFHSLCRFGTTEQGFVRGMSVGGTMGMV